MVVVVTDVVVVSDSAVSTVTSVVVVAVVVVTVAVVEVLVVDVLVLVTVVVRGLTPRKVHSDDAWAGPWARKRAVLNSGQPMGQRPRRRSAGGAGALVGGIHDVVVMVPVRAKAGGVKTSDRGEWVKECLGRGAC